MVLWCPYVASHMYGIVLHSFSQYSSVFQATRTGRKFTKKLLPNLIPLMCIWRRDANELKSCQHQWRRHVGSCKMSRKKSQNWRTEKLQLLWVQHQSIVDFSHEAHIDKHIYNWFGGGGEGDIQNKLLNIHLQNKKFFLLIIVCLLS